MSLKKRLYQALRILRRRQSSTKAKSETPPPVEVPPSPKPPSSPPSEEPPQPPDVPSFSDVETISLNPTVQSIQRGVEEVRLQKPNVLDVLLNPEVDYDGLWYAPKLIAPPPHIANREAPSSLESILAPRKAPPIPSEVKHGTRIYKFVKPIGHGGYGHVYMGHGVDTYDVIKKPQYVAIKVIQKHTLRLTHFDTIGPTSHYGMTTQDILTEVAILKSLNAAKWCPFLIKVLACFQDPENCYFVTRLYPQSLAGRLEALRKAHLLMPLEQIRQYGFEMAIALKAIHDQGICHLDIKPDNLMISPLGHLILVDFGCALFRTTHPLTVHTGWRGTPGYASPEARLGQVADSWHKCDTFSCGVVMAEMLMCPFGIFNEDRRIDFAWAHCLHYDPLAKSLVSSLLTRDFRRRFNYDRFQSHQFFAELRIVEFIEKKYRPTYRPPPFPEIRQDVDEVEKIIVDYNDPDASASTKEA